MDSSHLAAGVDVNVAIVCAWLLMATLAAVHIVALVRCAGVPVREVSTKIFWILAILLMPLLGSLLWFSVGKSQMDNRPLTDL